LNANQQGVHVKNFNLHGVMQAPVTPLKDDFSFDVSGFEKMVDFHVRHGAPAIAWPHHKAE
jgi:dihydrodipicolinate synthase/N-acetylneuraminate lyase